MSIVQKVLSVLFTLCRWAAGTNSTTSTSRKSPTFAWNEGGDSHPDYISASSAMRGERSAKLDQAMKAPINQDKIRKAGF